MQQLSAMPSDGIFTFHITAHQAMQRLDKSIADQLPAYSRTFLQEFIINGQVTINGAIVTKPKTLLKEHDCIQITFSSPQPTQEIDPAKTDYPYNVTIIEKHEHFLIINKPAGLTVHKINTTDPQPTLVDWIITNFQEIKNVGIIDRPGIVHRLDKDTSGILIIPRTNYAHAQFGSLFKERAIHKTYYALVQGHPPHEGTISLPIGRHPTLRHKMAAFKIHESQKGTIRDAVTHYKVLRYFKNTSLVEVKPVTGRTHQIRVHFAALGHSLIGDHVYGKKSNYIKRQALHAHAINFEFQNKIYSFTAPLPEDFQEALIAYENQK